jgi:hypothetical protein
MKLPTPTPLLPIRNTLALCLAVVLAGCGVSSQLHLNDTSTTNLSVRALHRFSGGPGGSDQGAGALHFGILAIAPGGAGRFVLGITGEGGVVAAQEGGLAAGADMRQALGKPEIGGVEERHGAYSAPRPPACQIPRGRRVAPNGPLESPPGRR